MLSGKTGVKGNRWSARKYTARLMLGGMDGEMMIPVKNIIH